MVRPNLHKLELGGPHGPSSLRLRNGKKLLLKDRLGRILILAGDSDGNIGDKAIVYSMCEELKKSIPGVAITILSLNPDESRHYFKVATIQRGLKGMLPLLAAIRKSDAVLCGGGGLFQDDDSRIKMPYWGLRLAMIRLLGKSAIGYSLGVGPLKHGLSRFFARLAFGCMDMISVRDPEAMAVCRRLTARPVVLLPDPALTLKPASPAAADAILRRHHVPEDGSPLIGVAARKWFHHRSSFIPYKYVHRLKLRRSDANARFDRLTLQLASVLDRLVETHGAYIVFLPSYNVAHEGDDRACLDIGSKMRSRRTSLIRISDPRHYKALAGKLDVLLGGRMHPTIFAAGMGTPVVGLAYNPKFNGFFRMIGCENKLLALEAFVDRRLTEELYTIVAASLSGGNRCAEDVVAVTAARLRAFNLAIRNRCIKRPGTKRPAFGEQGKNLT